LLFLTESFKNSTHQIENMQKKRQYSIKPWQGIALGVILYTILFLFLTYSMIRMSYASIDLILTLEYSVALTFFPFPGFLILIALCIAGFLLARKNKQLFSILCWLIILAGGFFIATSLPCLGLAKGEGAMLCIFSSAYGIIILAIGAVLMLIQYLVKKKNQ
jgi:hypothetical protein